MRLPDLIRTFDIGSDVADLVESVERRTGKPVEFRIDKDAKAPAPVKIARNRMEHHLLTLDPARDSVAAYPPTSV